MNDVKLTELTNWLKRNDISLAYISDPASVAYFTGFESEPHERILALFVPAESAPFLFTPALDVKEAEHSGFAYDVVGYLDNESPFEKIKTEITARYGLPKEMALEKGALTLDRFEAIQSAFLETRFSFDLTPEIARMQLIKTTAEIDKLLTAGSWADVAFEIGFKAIKEGISEQEIVAEIEYHLKKQGISHMSFDTLVLAGENAANPHGTPGARQIEANQLVLFDLGVIANGYCSDATRTVAYKEPTALQQKIHKIVLEAQLTAQAAVKPGILASELDKIARDVIAGYGYGEYFNHRLGHGIGASVHEYPSLVEGNDLIIEEGMCFSLEPGIYIPNQVGVRIEDCVYVTKDGCQPFTTTPKELMILN